MKKVLVLGSFNDDFSFSSTYLKSLVNILEKNNKVYLYNYSRGSAIIENSTQYLTFLPKFRKFAENNFLRHFYRILSFFLFFIKYNIRFELTHIHYLKIEYLFLQFFLYKRTNKLIISIYGSDLNDIKGNLLVRLANNLLNKSSAVFVTNEKFKYLILEKFRKIDIKDKIFCLMLPIHTLELIKNVSPSDIEKFKANYNFQPDDIIICCGNNGNIENEQLYEMVDELSKIGKKYTKIKFLFTLGARYGLKEEDLKNFIEYVNKTLNKDNVTFFNSFLTFNEIAIIRKITKIHISLRKNDQFAASIIEALFSGSYVIIGDWVDYPILEQNNIYFAKLPDINQLGEVIENFLDKFNNIKYVEQLTLNKDKIENLFGFDKIKKQWEKIYNNFLIK